MITLSTKSHFRQEEFMFKSWLALSVGEEKKKRGRRFKKCREACWEGGRGVPVRAVPLINGCSACRALLGVRHVARRARDVVVRDNGWTHRLKRPIGGVAPARGSGGQELKGVGEGGGVGHPQRSVRGGGEGRRARNKQVQT